MKSLHFGEKLNLRLYLGFALLLLLKNVADLNHCFAQEQSRKYSARTLRPPNDDHYAMNPLRPYEFKGGLGKQFLSMLFKVFLPPILFNIL